MKYADSIATSLADGWGSGPTSALSKCPEFNEALVRPAKLVSATGDVQNAEALVEGHEGDTILSWGGVGSAPWSSWTTDSK